MSLRFTLRERYLMRRTIKTYGPDVGKITLLQEPLLSWVNDWLNKLED